MPQPQSGPGVSDGLDLLLAILKLSSDASEARKILTGARLAGTAGARVAGYPEIVGGGLQGAYRGAVESGLPGLVKGGGLSGAASAAGLGLTLADIASSDMTTKQKIGYGTQAGADVALSAAPVIGPFYALSRIFAGVGNQLQRSGSPQVRGAGRAISHVGEPHGATALRTTLRGENPWKGMSTRDIGEDLTIDLLGPLGSALKGAGLDRKVAGAIMDYGPLPGFGQFLKMFGGTPTHGTQFRHVLNQVIGKAGFEDFKGTSQYNMDPEAWAKIDPKTRDAATVLGYTLASVTPQFKKNPYAYGIQAQNVLLNQYGDKVQEHAARILKDTKPEDVLRQIATAGNLQPEQLQSVWRALTSYYGLPATAPPEAFQYTR